METVVKASNMKDVSVGLCNRAKPGGEGGGRENRQKQLFLNLKQIIMILGVHRDKFNFL